MLISMKPFYTKLRCIQVITSVNLIFVFASKNNLIYFWSKPNIFVLPVNIKVTNFFSVNEYRTTPY